MKSVAVVCPAKVNLTFDILGLRPDGYHEVETLFQSITLFDTLKFQIEDWERFDLKLECSNPYVRKAMPLDDTNLIARAAAKFFEQAGLRPDCRITVELDKLIPVAAGLAGGSADAAGTLYALNSLFGQPFNRQGLEDIAEKIGADVAFCLSGGTAIGRGKGERLEPVMPAVKLTYCIVKPRKLSVSTPEAYRHYDEFTGQIARPDLSSALKGLTSGDVEVALSGFANVLEPVVFTKHPQLAEIKTKLLQLGAWDCRMSGSGPTLFAVVPSREMAHHLRRSLLNDDELGFFYGTDQVLAEGLPPLDIRIAETCDHGVVALDLVSRG